MKGKVLGIGNEGNFNFIIFEKNKNFMDNFTNLMSSSLSAMPDLNTIEKIDENDKLVTQRKKIEEIIDRHESHEAEGARLDIFYGKDKVFVIVLTSPKNRKKLMENLEKYFVFVEGDKK